MRINAIINRIIIQFFRDKRTLMLLLFAPILVLTLMDYVFTEHEVGLNIGVENENLKNILKSIEYDNEISIMDKEESIKKFKKDKLDAYLYNENMNIKLTLNGSDSTISSQVIKAIQGAIKESIPTQANTINLKVENYYGKDNMKTIDYIGPFLIGFFIFFFVFLIAGVSFLRERTSGTLERLLASPIKRYEIVLGYLIGFGIFTIFQATIIVGYSIWILDIYNAGSIGLILLVSIVISLCALSLGMFLSSYAKNEFQIIQFIPLVIVPQVFFSGLFSIRKMIEPLQYLAKCMPLTYAGEALKDVMTIGASFSDVLPNLLALLIFTLVFAVLNIVVLKKHRIW